MDREHKMKEWKWEGGYFYLRCWCGNTAIASTIDAMTASDREHRRAVAQVEAARTPASPGSHR